MLVNHHHLMGFWIPKIQSIKLLPKELTLDFKSKPNMRVFFFFIRIFLIDSGDIQQQFYQVSVNIIETKTVKPFGIGI